MTSQKGIRQRHGSERKIGQYRIQPVNLLRLWRLVSTTIRAIRSTAEKAGRGGAGRRSADGTAQGADLRLGGALACLPRGLEGLEHALHLSPCRRVPRLELGLVRVDEDARVLHARWRRAHRAVGYRRKRGGAGWRGELLSEVRVGVKLGEQVLLLLLLLLLLRGIAVAGLLRLLVAVASGLLRWIVGVLALHLQLWVACGEGVDLTDKLLAVRARRLEIRWGIRCL